MTRPGGGGGDGIGPPTSTHLSLCLVIIDARRRVDSGERVVRDARRNFPGRALALAWRVARCASNENRPLSTPELPNAHQRFLRWP
jgi:hypothetical protein